MKNYVIEHKGKTLETSHFYPLTEQECEDIRQAYYKKPEISEVKNNFLAIEKGSVIASSIMNYYMKDLMAKVKLYSPRWSIEEVLECNDLIRYFWSRVIASEKVYPPEHGTIRNFETALRISGGGVAMKPSNFPMKTIDMILQKYNINGNYYDYSCGWGIRMLSSLKNRVNYYGTDPNNLLIDRLNQIKDTYQKTNKVELFTDIRCIGSQHLQQDWIGKIGIAFSSPPYFGLEDYKIGEQSYSDGMSYTEWLNSYLHKTIENCYKYLIPGGYFMINIKDYENYSLIGDSKLLALKSKFRFIEELLLKNKKRPSAKKDLDTNEKILVFQK